MASAKNAKTNAKSVAKIAESHLLPVFAAIKRGGGGKLTILSRRPWNP
jgi:acetyl/propionyl-CoA carboxylase alpha subunit